MKEKMRKSWKNRISSLLVLCLVICAVLQYIPAQTVQAETSDVTSYTVTMGVGKRYFICNKKETTGTVILKYTVKSGAPRLNDATHGVVATVNRDAEYPYAGTLGDYNYHVTQNVLLSQTTRTITMSVDADGVLTHTGAYMTSDDNDGTNPDCRYFGIYIENLAEAAELIDVTCTDAAGNDLGVYVKCKEGNFTVESSEDPATYAVTLGVGKRYFVCNSTPSNGPVTLSYTAKSGTPLSGATYGVIATSNRDADYPYAGTSGDYNYHTSGNVLLGVDNTRTITMSVDADGVLTHTGAYMPSNDNDGTNASCQYFGIYFENLGEAAELINVTCTDVEGNNLGVYVKSLTGEFTVQETEKVLTYPAKHYTTMKNAGTYPTKDGFLFAGWFADKKCTTALTTAPTEGDAYAKFVMEDVLTVKAQVTPNTSASSTETAIRFVTTVDSLNYKEVGFYISIGSGEEKKKPLTKVYGSLVVVNADGTGGEADTRVTPSEFSPESAYFATYAYWKVPTEHFTTAFKVTPYWVTLDGTEVRADSNVETKTVSLYYESN